MKNRSRTGGLVVTLLVAALLGACGRTPDASGPTLGDALVQGVDVVFQGANGSFPLDSAPDPDALNIFFVTGGSNAGVFSVPAGGGTPSPLAADQQLSAPTGIVSGIDGQHVFVADTGAPAPNGQHGAIFVVAAKAGPTTTLRGSAGYAPQGVDVAVENDKEFVYFTGADPQDGSLGVFKLPASGADAPTVVAKGAPFVGPDGVAVARNGIVYVTDRTSPEGQGTVRKIENGKVATVVDTVQLGDPAGLALSKDEQILLVSALQKDRPNDQVLLVNLGNGATGAVTAVVGENHAPGGVHRARNSNTFAWADLQAGGGGKVYRIKVGG